MLQQKRAGINVANENSLNRKMSSLPKWVFLKLEIEASCLGGKKSVSITQTLLQ